MDFSAILEIAYISCPASLTLAICSGKDKIVWLGMYHEALMSLSANSFSMRSVPTLAPKMPRVTSVAPIAEPSRVLILHSVSQGLVSRVVKSKSYQLAQASTSMAYVTSALFVIVR